MLCDHAAVEDYLHTYNEMLYPPVFFYNLSITDISFQHSLHFNSASTQLIKQVLAFI